MSESHPENPLPRIQSRFADDPRMKAILSRFVSGLQDRSVEFEQATRDDDRTRIAWMAHQLKGAAGGYGFDSISDAAGEIETFSLSMEADISSVRERVEGLIQLCRSATSE